MLQRPDATQVAGYKKWPELNRHVKKGETALRIFAPLVYKNEEDEPEVRGFRLVSVFDVSQTDGEPLPPAPDYNNTGQQCIRTSLA